MLEPIDADDRMSPQTATEDTKFNKTKTANLPALLPHRAHSVLVGLSSVARQPTTHLDPLVFPFISFADAAVASLSLALDLSPSLSL